MRERLRFEGAWVASAPGSPELAGEAVSPEVDDPELLRIRETSPHIQAAPEGMDGENPELLLLLDRPAPGLAHIFLMPMGGPTMVSVRFHLFGEHAAEAAADAERAWSEWLFDRFSREFPA